jgi:hypothetical protein
LMIGARPAVWYGAANVMPFEPFTGTPMLR